MSGCPEDVPKTEADPKTSTETSDGGINDAGPAVDDHVAGPFHIRFAPEDGQVPYPMAGLLDTYNLLARLAARNGAALVLCQAGRRLSTTQAHPPAHRKPQMSTLTDNLLVVNVRPPMDGRFFGMKRARNLCSPRANPSHRGASFKFCCGVAPRAFVHKQAIYPPRSLS